MGLHSTQNNIGTATNPAGLPPHGQTLFRGFFKAPSESDFREAIVEEIPHLRRYARSLEKKREPADDLVQACLERAISRSHLWKEGTNLRAWLFKIMYNLFISEKRKQSRVQSLPEGWNPDQYVSMPASQHLSAELKGVSEALDTLPKEQRAVLLLVALEEMSYQEIAEIMGIPVGTVRSRLSRARETMRGMFEIKD